MNTTDLIHEIARRSKPSRRPLTRAQAEHALDLLLEIMIEELAQEGGEVRLRGFGVFRAKQAKKSGGRLKRGTEEAANDRGETYLRVQFKRSRTSRN